MSNATTTFGSWLKQRRRGLGLTQSDLAQQIPCAEITIRKLESGMIRPGKDIAERLAICLGLTPTEQEQFIQVGRGLATPVPTSLLSPSFPTRTNILRPPIAIIGRETEISAVCERLSRQNIRLLTLVGLPGIGKTRLSIEVALQVHDDFQDGAFFVRLAPIQSAEQVIIAIAQTLDVQPLGDAPLLESIKVFLQSRHLLLLLDNFEHVIGAAPAIGEMLANAPHLKVLVTSREPLHLQAEHTFALPPLATPPVVNHSTSYQSHLRYPAVQLFVERAQAVNSDFALNAANGHAVAELCMRLEGLPLAIELAARRSNIYGPRALLTRLSKRLTMLTGKVRDLPARQQTLQAAIDWSYDLLPRTTKRVLARVGVFWGGFTIASAEAVCNDRHISVEDIWDALAALVDKSLLTQSESVDGEPRFAMLEMVREYALDRLAQDGELEHIQLRHYNTFLALALEGEQGLKGADQEAWLNRLTDDLPNLRAALTWTLGNSSRTDAGLHLAATLGLFWEYAGLQNEGHQWISTLLTQGGTISTTVHAKALAIGGFMLGWMGAYSAAKPWLETSVQLCRTTGDKHGLALALFMLRFVYEETDPPVALQIMEECIALYRTLDDTLGLARALGAYALVVGIDQNISEAQLEIARAACHESEQLLQKTGDRWSLVWTIVGTASIAAAENNTLQAYRQWVLAGQYWQGSRNHWGVLTALNMAAQYAIGMNEYQRAIGHFEELYTLTMHMVGARRCHVLINLGESYQATGDLLRALELYRETATYAYRYKMEIDLGASFGCIATMIVELCEQEEIPVSVFQALLGTRRAMVDPSELGIYAATLLGTHLASLERTDPYDVNRTWGPNWEPNHWFSTAARVQTLIGEEVYRMSVMGGYTMTAEQAVTYAVGQKSR